MKLKKLKMKNYLFNLVVIENNILTFSKNFK